MDTIGRTASAEPANGRAAFRARPSQAQRGVEFPPFVPHWSSDLTEDASAVEALRVEMAVLRERLAQAAPRRTVAEMDKAIGVLNRRVEALGTQWGRESAAEPDSEQTARAGASPTESGPGPRALASELSALKASLEAMRVPERFEALSAGIGALTRRLDAVDPRATAPREVAHLAAQVAELKDLVSRALAGQALQRLAERIASCADEVARAGEVAARKMDGATEAFQRSADALFARIQQLQVATSAADAAGTAHLQRKFSADFDRLNRRLDALGRQMAELSPAAQRTVAGELSALVERLEMAARSAPAPDAALSRLLEERLSGLTERVRETGAQFSRLDGIEAQLSRLTEEMRLVREAAAASAATSAAEVAHAVVMKVSEDPAGPAVVGLKRGLALLEARQDEIERRTREVLVGDVELELEELTGSLGRSAEGDGVWIARGREEAVAHRGPVAPPFEEVEAAFADALAADAASGRKGPDLRARRSDTEEAAGSATAMPWPKTPGAAERGTPSASGTEGQDTTSVKEEAKGWWRYRDRGRSKGSARDRANAVRQSAGQRKDARRQAALVALLGGALVVFVGTAGLLAWHALPGGEGPGTTVEAQLAGPMPTVVSDRTALPEPSGPLALRQAARAGDAAAAYEVGVRFAEGRGVPADPEAAAQWLGQAVALGSVPAAYRLAALKEHVDNDLAEAARLYRFAAERGHVRAMHALAVLSSRGVNGTPDWPAASRWTRAAAERGLRDAQHNLGVILARGLAGQADPARAWKWFALAAAQGDADSAAKRDALAPRVDPAELLALQQEVAAFSPKVRDAAANTVATRPEWEDEEPALPQVFKAASVMPSGR